MIYELHRGDGEPPQPCASLADAIEASGVPAICWSASVATHPDEIATFVPVRQAIRAPGAAAEFAAAERLARRLPPTGANTMSTTAHRWVIELSYISKATDKPVFIEAGGEHEFAPGTSREQARETVKRMLADRLAGDPRHPLDRLYVPAVLSFTLDPDLPS